MTQALYRKWRPQTWDDVIGQGHIIQTLQNAIKSGRTGHAYLFAGPRGTGKTSTARLLAKAVNCLDEKVINRPCNNCVICLAVNQGNLLDLIEIDAASNTSVDDIRDLRDKINFSPSQGKYKIYIIDEVHMLSTAAFNALLKTLEEPPPHAIFILATTEIHKIPATVLSRCQRHEFRRISIADIVSQLNEIVKEEDLKIDSTALQLIARQSTGAMRDAISLLDQLASTGELITLEIAQNVLGTATSQSVLEIVNSIINEKTSDGLNAIHAMLDGGADPRQFARQIVEYLRNLLLTEMGNPVAGDQTAEIQAQIEKHSQQLTRAEILFCLQRYNAIAADTRGNWQPNLPLELALAECVDYKKLDQSPVVNQVIANSIPQTKSTAEPENLLKQAFKPEKTKIVKSKQSKSKVEDILSSSPGYEKSQPPGEKDVEEVPASGMVQSEDLRLSMIRDNWDKIRQEVRTKSPAAEALLNSCKSIGVKNGDLVLGFASELVKSKMETKENLALACRAILDVIKTDVSIRCIVVSKKTSSSTEDNLEGDGMVNAALNLGGQIVQKE